MQLPYTLAHRHMLLSQWPHNNRSTVKMAGSKPPHNKYRLQTARTTTMSINHVYSWQQASQQTDRQTTQMTGWLCLCTEQYVAAAAMKWHHKLMDRWAANHHHDTALNCRQHTATQLSHRFNTLMVKLQNFAYILSDSWIQLIISPTVISKIKLKVYIAS